MRGFPTRLLAALLAGLLTGACASAPAPRPRIAGPLDVRPAAESAAPTADGEAPESGGPPPGSFSGSPAGATALAALFPGLGHFYLKDFETGTGLAVLGGLELTATAVTMFDGWPEAGGELGADPTFLLASTWYQNTVFYSMYAAYRDARRLLNNRGYRYRAPDDSLTELLLAPLNPDVIGKPEVGLGLLGMVGLGLLASWLIEGNLRTTRHVFDGERVNFMGGRMHAAEGFALGEIYTAALFTPVGIGEEALFRGVLQTGLTEYWGPWGGWAGASLVFGAAHAPNALAFDDRRTQIRYLAIGVPFLSLLGGYMGWVYMHNNFSLAESTALHFWYDFIMGTLSFILDPDSQPFAVRLSLPF